MSVLNIKNYLKLSQLPVFFLKLFLLVFPFQIQTLLYKADFFSGQFNFFSAFFFSAGEIILFLAFFTWLINRYLQKEKSEDLMGDRWGEYFWGLMGLLVLLSFASVFWAIDKNLALLYALRWLEIFVLVFLLGQKLLPTENLLKYLWWGAFIQVVIGLGQYLRQGDLGLGVLGEPKLGADYFNIAKIDLGGAKILRSYGTLPHANVFGGYLFICTALLIKTLNRDNLYKYAHFLVAFLIGLLVSFSRSAWLALLIFLLVIWGLKAVKINWKQLLLSLVLLVFVLVVFSLDQVILSRILNFSLASWDERLIFSGVAREIITHNYLLGIGGGNFILAMPMFAVENLAPWLYQPAHNFFLLALSELGVAGLLLWLGIWLTVVKMVLFYQHRKTLAQQYGAKAYYGLLSGLGILMLFDHYFYTIWAGQVMLGLVIGIIYADYKNRQKELAE